MKFISINYLNIQSLLICLLPLAIIVGPFFADLIIVTSGIYIIYYSLNKKDFYYLLNPISIMFWIFCTYLIIRSIFSINPILSLESSLFYFRFGLFALAVWCILNNNKNFTKLFLYSLVITFSLTVLDGYLQFFSGKNILGYPYHYSRLTGFFGDEMVLGSYLARLFPLLFGLIILQYEGSKKSLLFIFILLILTDVIIFLSGEKTSFFLFILSTIIVICCANKFRALRIFAFMVSILIIIIFTFQFDNVKTKMLDDTLAETNILGDRPMVFTAGHEQIFTTAIKMFLDKPLFGHGPKLYREICSKPEYVVFLDDSKTSTACTTHPHNSYLQLLSETGIIGLIPILSLFIYLVYKFAQQLSRIIFLNEVRLLSDYQVCLLATLLISIWPLAPSMNFFNNWISIIYFLPIGFILHSFYGKKE